MAMASSANVSVGNDDEFTICVTSTAPPPLLSSSFSGAKNKQKQKQPPQQQQQRLRFNLRVKPSTPLEQMQKDVLALFNVPVESINAYRLSFLGGFPPKELQTEGKHTVHEMGIRPNEMLIVKFALSSGKTKVENGNDVAINEKDSSSNVQELTTAASSTGTGRQKRAAAIAATANFHDVIAAQDAILNNKSPPTKKRSSASSNIAGFGRSGTIGAIKSNAATRKRPKVMEGPGYRLSDGVESPPLKKPKDGAKHRGEQPMFNSEDDVASKLLDSLGGSGRGRNVSNYLRAAMRNAVEKSYEASRASVRVAAVNTGEYSFKKVDSVVGGEKMALESEGGEASRGDEMLRKSLHTVSYSKGIEGRGCYEEEVEIIGLDVLKSVLESVYNTDSSGGYDDKKVCDGSNDGRLRPVLIAQLSPRAFWSLVYHCHKATKIESSTTRPSVEYMLQSTLPQLDWSHLDRGGRMRVLSEKARENLKQQAAETAPTDTQTLSSNHAEDEKVKAVEELAESVYNTAVAKENEDSKLNDREMRVKAAMARFQNANTAVSSSLQPPDQKNDTSTDDWTLITPIEDDIDELIECIMEGSSTTEGDTTTLAIAQSLAGVLLKTVRNWRELANSNADYLYSLFADDTISPRPSHDNIEQWITSARVRSMDEIMLDILDGDQDALELLRGKAHSGTPRELLFWKSAPGMLLNTISNSSEESSATKWTKSDVRRWIARGKTAMGVCTWLEMYTTQTIP